MLSKRTDNNRNQLEMVALDQLVPEDHLVRKIEQAIDFDFIYDLVKDTYCLDNGRPSIDPVVLIKMVFVQYLFVFVPCVKRSKKLKPTWRIDGS